MGGLRFGFSLLLPLTAYLFYRSTFGSFRAFSPNLVNLSDFEAYGILLRAYLEQAGVFVLIMILGWVYLANSGHYSSLTFFVLAFLADASFHILDSDRFIGYSRFNLFLVPLFVVGASVFIRALAMRSKRIALALLSAVVVINLLLSPINGDGTKKPYWGEYRAEISEHYYPYREAIAWLSQMHPSECVTFVTGTYRYFVGFYLERYSQEPCFKVVTVEADKRSSMGSEQFIEEAWADGSKLILVQDMDDSAVPTLESSTFSLERVFENDAHRLLLFSAASSP